MVMMGKSKCKGSNLPFAKAKSRNKIRVSAGNYMMKSGNFLPVQETAAVQSELIK